MRLNQRGLSSIAVHNNKVLAVMVNGQHLDIGSLAASSVCMYGNCRARNLCKSGFCVGINMLRDGYIIEDGGLRAATDDERKQAK